MKKFVDFVITTIRLDYKVHLVENGHKKWTELSCVMEESVVLRLDDIRDNHQ